MFQWKFRRHFPVTKFRRSLCSRIQIVTAETVRDKSEMEESFKMNNTYFDRYVSTIWPMSFNRFGKAKLNKGESLRRDKLVDEITIHGLPLAFKARNWPARFFWAALFLGMLFALLWQLEKIYSSISSTPTMINMQQQKKAALLLPIVTICSTQSFNATKLFIDGISLNLGDLAHLSGESLKDRNVTDEEADTLILKRNQIYRKVSSWKEFLNIYGVQCKQFFARCQIDWETFDCCEAFTPLYSMEEGVCFRYTNQNSGGILQDEPGINGSLQILLRTPILTPYWSGGPKWNGITVGLPYLWDPFVASTGKFVLAQIRGQINVRDPSTINCYPPDNWMDRDAGCSQTAWQDAIIEICNCSLYELGDEKNRTLCDPFTFTLCMRDFGLEARTFYADLSTRKCRQVLCEEWEFQVFVSYADINRAWVKATIGTAEKNFEYTLLNFYFPSLVYSEIREFQQVTFENIISQVGGLMGLWIGASMISIIQLLVYALQYVLDKFMDWVQVKEADTDLIN